MCGRYTLKAQHDAIAQEFDLPEVPLLEPRYNIAPTLPVVVIRFDPIEGTRRLDLLRPERRTDWDFVPYPFRSNSSWTWMSVKFR
jgi:putative SOS response-associated peptidase YedK